MVPLILLSGYSMIRYLTDEWKDAACLYLLFMFCCVPIYLYVPFVYGDLCATAFVMLGGWCLLSCLKTFSWWKVVLLGLCVGIAVQLRQNALIPLIAFLIVLLVK